MNNINFDYKEDYVLENKRVQIRPLKNDNFQYLLEYSIHEPDIWNFNIGGANGEDNLIKYIETAIS